MKLILLIFLAAISLAACSSDKIEAQNTENKNSAKISQIPEKHFRPGEFEIQDFRRKYYENKPPENTKNKEVVPIEWRKTDFENFIYPNIYPYLEDGDRAFIRLKKGKLEYVWKKQLRGETFEFGAVKYLDFTGDGIKEALVNLSNTSCGGSCGVSEYFYIYSSNKGITNLLWKFSTGSNANCGTFENKIENSEIVIKMFGKCVWEKTYWSSEDSSSKMYTKSATILRFGWNGKSIVQKDKKFLSLTEMLP